MDQNNKKHISHDTGYVWLAGAGPGDAGLMTLKGADLIRQADLIVYDALISAEILSMIPPEKETVYVGKQAGYHAVPQEKINQVLVREAKKGKKVLRLKGGDPFVFGRGGEELEILAREGIPFEAVPGVTSSVAVPAYAGIPVTHRDYASSFHVITGHAKKDGTPDIDFDALVRLRGTLVFLMGVASMGQILDGLMRAGMARDMPAAVLERGTTARQRRIVSSVGTLKEEAQRAGIQAPAVIVVGQVCALSETFCWAEKRALGGRQFLLTRPRQNMSVLAGRLRALGAQVIEMPAISTQVISPNRKLKEELSDFAASHREKWLVFTSPIGVAAFFGQLAEMKLDIRQVFCMAGKAKIAAIGRATASSLLERGLVADLVPEVYSAAALGEKLADQAGTGSDILVARAEDGSEELLPPLLGAGFRVKDVPLYRTVCEMHPLLRQKIENLLENGEIDAVTFTSRSTVRGFAQAVGNPDFGRIQAVCIGEQTAGAAAEYGMETVISDEASTDSLVEKIVELYGNSQEERYDII